MKTEQLIMRVNKRNENVFAKASGTIRLMQEVLGEKFLINYIGEGLPKKWNKRKRKKEAKKQWLVWRIVYLKENGLEVFHE